MVASQWLTLFSALKLFPHKEVYGSKLQLINSHISQEFHFKQQLTNDNLVRLSVQNKWDKRPRATNFTKNRLNMIVSANAPRVETANRRSIKATINFVQLSHVFHTKKSNILNCKNTSKCSTNSRVSQKSQLWKWDKRQSAACFSNNGLKMMAVSQKLALLPFQQTSALVNNSIFSTFTFFSYKKVLHLTCKHRKFLNKINS